MKNENLKVLLDLIKNNPELPVVALVRSEVVGDDYGYWLGSIDEACVDKYILFATYDFERYFSYSDIDEIEEYIANEMWDNEEYSALPDDIIKQIAHNKALNLPWKKAIIVYIELPDIE